MGPTAVHNVVNARLITRDKSTGNCSYSHPLCRTLAHTLRKTQHHSKELHSLERTPTWRHHWNALLSIAPIVIFGANAFNLS